LFSARSFRKGIHDRPKDGDRVIALAACVVAFAATFLAGKRSLATGLIVLLAVGYFYGILRANLLTAFSHFIFDAGTVGLYFSQRWTSSDLAESRRLATLRWWLVALILWPCLLVLMPFQPLMVSLVGLRGNIFFLPMALLGARLRNADVHKVACGLALLNLAVFGFAIAEYFMGVPRFYPRSPVTDIIYHSSDVAVGANGGYFRIPATFANAHSYGGAMVASLPYLIGLWTVSATRKGRILAVLGTIVALIGILMSAARQDFILGSAIIVITLLKTRMKAGARVVFLLVLAVIGWLALSNARLERFKSLSDTSYVQERIAGSVNRGFFEILFDYPLGNGLGGGGTSMPYFLEGQIRNPIAIENEYGRILAEQSFIGLLLWIGFVGWFFSRGRVAFAPHPWTNTRRMVWCLTAIWLGTAWIGLGVLTSIPNSVMLLLGIGWTTTLAAASESRTAARTGPDRRTYTPVYAG